MEILDVVFGIILGAFSAWMYRDRLEEKGEDERYNKLMKLHGDEFVTTYRAWEKLK